MTSAESFLMMLPQSIPAKDRAALGRVMEELAKDRKERPDITGFPDEARAVLQRPEVMEANALVAARYIRVIADLLPDLDEETKRFLDEQEAQGLLWGVVRAEPEEFDFSDVHNGGSPGGATFCERVRRFFTAPAPGPRKIGPGYNGPPPPDGQPIITPAPPRFRGQPDSTPAVIRLVKALAWQVEVNQVDSWLMTEAILAAFRDGGLSVADVTRWENAGNEIDRLQECAQDQVRAALDRLEACQ